MSGSWFMEFAMHFVNPLRKMFLCAFLLWAALASAAESHTWLPVDPKDLQMKEFKQIPGAEAVLLYYQNEIDDVNHTDFLYSRIKVLTDSGKRHANVEIPMTEKTSVMDLVARTIHPDGRIVDLTDRPFEKVVFQGKGLRVRVQAFTLPQVSAGDIIEYRYELHYKGLLHHHWTVQHDLYAVKEHFRFRYDKKYSVKWLSTAGLQQSPEHDTKSGVLQMDSENVAPFEAEEQMPPEEGYKLQVKFFYTSPFMGSPSAYWYETGRWWSQGVDYFLGNHKEIVSAATEAVGNETDPEKKLRKLYARAQEIRNLTTNANERRKNKKGKNSRTIKTSWKYCGMDMATATTSPAFLWLWPAAQASLHPWFSSPAANQDFLTERCCLSASLIPRLPGCDSTANACFLIRVRAIHPMDCCAGSALGRRPWI